ncbi:hypothetical protein Mal64_29410 [Pseudobythopirellula maris]|uniref:Uncharacterized protein n=1 Tax=Pseudobythopirellula maris TaxID=2527991 RepID=A0A5C5ZJ34_9BACT|nr:hypothetical protein [Pseudobythopirellula maris]TWT87402.1 hypothetical protein Mal64_29410 [Pseudobythopirellula maris]
MRDSRPTEDRDENAARRFFAGLTEQAFMTELGVADPPLVDYVSGLLVRFLRSDDIYSVRSVRGERLTQVADMLAEAMARRGQAKRQLLRHVGDFTLFWTGLYPEIADRIRKAGMKDMLIDYREQGKHSYATASKIPVERESAPSDVLERLADEFELCAYGLGEVRKAWEESGGGEPTLLL